MKIPVKRETLDWLLSKENPPVRYLTLARLLERWEGSREVRDARARLGEYEPTRRILAARARFWPWLKEEFPRLLPRYERLYGRRDYLRDQDTSALLSNYRRLKLEYGFPRGGVGRC